MGSNPPTSARGAGVSQGVWNVDGVTITDMGALGSSHAYCDFDSFEEVQISTGGSDLMAASGSVLDNRGSYESTFNGVGLTATKPLSHRWMRGTFSFGDSK